MDVYSAGEEQIIATLLNMLLELDIPRYVSDYYVFPFDKATELALAAIERRALEAEGLRGVLGTVAGDDSIFVAVESKVTGGHVVDLVERHMGDWQRGIPVTSINRLIKVRLLGFGWQTR